MPDERNPGFPHTSPWDDIHEHAWKDVEDMSGRGVVCKICGCPGERMLDGSGVYWPTT